MSNLGNRNRPVCKEEVVPALNHDPMTSGEIPRTMIGNMHDFGWASQDNSGYSGLSATYYPGSVCRVGVYLRQNAPPPARRQAGAHSLSRTSVVLMGARPTHGRS